MTVHFIVCWIVLRCTILNLHYCSVMYCTPLYNICFIKLYWLYTFVVWSTVLLYCIVCTLLWCSTPLYTFQDLNLIFCTHLVYACAPCVWWLFTVTCTVFCTLCILLEREGSLLARIGFLYRSTNGGGGSGQCRYPPILCSNSVVRPSHRGTTC